MITIDYIFLGLITIMLYLSSIDIYNYCYKNVKEGMDNTPSDIAILAYKNSGGIQNLQKSNDDIKNDIKLIYKNQADINSMNNQTTQLIQEVKLSQSINDTQNSKLQDLTSKQDEIKKMLTIAYTTSQDNKDRFVQMANQAKQSGNNAQNESNKISFN